MFNIGDKIIYPNQGIGTINSIEKIEFKGEMQNYYLVDLNNSMKLKIPVSSAELLNIRLVSDCNVIDDNLKNMSELKIGEIEFLSLNFRERNAINSKKLKSGTLVDCLEVVCNLTELKKQHALSSRDKEMLQKTKMFLIDEISESKNLPNDKAKYILNMAIKVQ
ncbi:CarD family transcriptional regulator [Clostridium neonatale]|uniref:CarD family transcriptional regulator n=1 Tax=Clostridium neonatale TaxID=137838 RepID=A0A2A7MDN2_9CLOT|nr:CarD family transcriptional regulator [Clostridium neonatale]PEG25996.1 CarD family transcriptional regulator [Clostridium neonatale]PEG29766.1 CarD family transcriptional regulator [Clostridium neonatale]CAH0435569.1 Putative transcriptional regulator, CarD-like/TRCF domain [Clostridium neonatale]